MRVYVAGLSHETNSFSPIPTSWQSFEQDVCYRPGNEAGRDAALGYPGYGDAVRAAGEHGHVVIEGPCFCTQPSGPMEEPLFETLRDELLAGLAAAGPVDLVIVNLHGAMLAQGEPDCEGDILARLRAQAGPDMPIGVLLDLHGNVSPRMVESGAILVGVKEYPHIDYRERAEQLLAILTAMAREGGKPRTYLYPVPVLSLQGTLEQPMRGLVDSLVEAEKRDGVLAVTLMHGFPWSDWELAGASVLIVAEEEVSGLAAEIAERYVAIATQAPVSRVDVPSAVAEALATPAGKGPVVIADSSDNAGGGAASDSTFLLHELLRRGVTNAALGMIWDPEAAKLAAAAGVGARLTLAVGGKVGPLSGPPADLEAEVVAIRSDLLQRRFSEEPVSALGLTVHVRAQGIDIVINSRRQQVFSTDCFTGMGIDLAGKDLVVVKSSQHFRATFDPIARRTLYCNAPGSLNTDLAQMPYRHLALEPRHGAFFVGRAG